MPDAMTASRLLGRTCSTPPDSRPRRVGALPSSPSVRRPDRAGPFPHVTRAAAPRRGLLRSARALAAAVWLATLGVPALPASPENATLSTDTTAAGTINNRVRNANPVFANTTETRTVRENSAPGTNVGLPIPEATDADAGDTLTYSMEGADAGSFAFDASTRQITTIANVDYNHEATKNSYSVTVKASDGTDSDTVAVTINVTDVDEQPAKPGRPRLATDPDSDSATTLDAIWREPLLNGGPAITGYDLEYREGTGGNWTGFAHSGTAVTTTITGLTGDTEYQMRVRAKNGEVDSEWSDASDGVRTEAADATLGVLRVVTDSAALADYQSNTTSYAMSVPNSDDEATVTATANDGGASVEILDSSDMGITDADAMKDGFQVALAVGSTVIKVKVTADDGTTTQTYTVTVTRATAGNNAPAFPSSTATREVPENSAAGTDVGLPIPEATDEDSGDTLTYSMGGADAGSFAFDASTRQITTKTGVTYNHEAAKNTYEVTVNADDGTDSGAIPVTINVTDVDEQPAKPGQPRLATVPGSSTSLTATWTKPGLNGGPEIIGYDVEHREGTSGDWIRFPHSGTEVTATITGLQANTEYQVQVRAENGEADSDWSDASDAVRTNVADAPESFEAWSGNAQVRLTWDAPGADADIARHEYRFKTTGDYPDLWTGIGDSAPGGAQEDGVVVTGLTNDVAYTFQLRSANADDASTAAAAGPVTPRPGVCSRTRQVRDAIVAAISDVSHCAQVTTTQLAGVTRLELQNTDLRSLQPDDFSGLTALYWLFLENNELSSLPAGVFSGLTALSSLNLRGNDLVSLPDDVFSGLTALQTLYLHANKLDLLPDDAFSGLTALRILQLNDNKLDLLADDAFSGLTALQRLRLSGNKLDLLADDVFSGLTALQRLYLTGNKLGSLPDDVFSGLTALQRLYLSGNKLGSLPADVFSGLTALQRLYLSGNKLDLLPAGVFSDLTALQRLGMSGNSLGSLPGDVFSGLTALTYLWVNNNELSSLPDGVFSDLTAIRQISLQNNPLGSLPDDVFSGLVALETLQLFENELSSLPDDVFSGLVALEILQLFENELSSLPDDVFSDLTALEELWLNDNDLAALPDGVFSGLTTLTTLSLGGNPNPGDVLPLTVTVEKVGTDQARAKVLAGAPFAVNFTPAVVNGALAGGATALGVAAGSVDGTAVTVERTSGTMAAVTVDVDLTTQPTLPEGHAGYEFAKATGSEPQEILPQVGTTPNNAPVFANATETRTVPENSTAGTNVGSPIPEATDADSGDTLTYSMEGADAASFAFDASTRQITTIANVFYNYEATKNSYSVTVKASDGTDSATVAVTINVTDVGGEAPAAPSAPSVSAASVTSLSVTWTAPANAGPAITDYDYRHRTTSPVGNWTEVTDTTSTVLSATIGSLAEDTSYDVQVRATNAEGTGDWSASGSGTTDANAAPAFDSSATFNPNENQTTAGTVVASDGDTEDEIEGYAITGGADQGKFSIHSTSGALTFKAAPNFEDPDDANTDGSYQVTVQATSGTGTREKTATQALTVTVADVNERSAKPAKPTLAPVADSTTSLAASWTKPDLDGGPDITDYDVRYREGTSGGWTDVTHNGAGRTRTLAGLAADTAYQAQVRADNGELESDWSDPSDAVRTNAEEATAPDAPRDVTATADGETRIDLDWRAPADDGGSAVTEYRIQVSDDGGLSFEALATTGAAVTRYTHTGLSAGTTRHYQVYAVNAEGESPPSSVVGATTDEEREPEGNEPSVIRTYWIGSGGSNDKSGCAGREEFRAYWNPPLESNRGNNRTYKVADAWEADITLRGGASDLGYTIQHAGGNPEHPELTGSVRIDGNGWLSMRVRGRFGADGWGGWSPTSSLYCRAASARVDGPLLALTWPTPRDGFAAPDGGDFAVHADGAAVAVTGAALVGRRALLTLGTPALAGQSVSVDYLGSAMHPLADAAGAPVPAWTDLAAENLTGEPPDAAWAAVLALAAAVRSDAPGPRALFNPGTDPASLSLAGAGLADADLAALASPGGLRRLDLSGNALTHVSLLADLRGLESLDLSGNALADIAPLSTLTALRRLDLRGNRVADLAPLASLSRLEVLLLDGNRIVDVGALTHLGTLEHLGLADNAVVDLAPLSDLWSLRRLDLGGNPAADLSPLGDLETLEWLRVPAANGVPAHRLIRLRWLWTGPAGVCLGCRGRAP